MGRFDLRVIDRESRQARQREGKRKYLQQLVWRAERGEVCRRKERKFERV